MYLQSHLEFLVRSVKTEEDFACLKTIYQRFKKVEANFKEDTGKLELINSLKHQIIETNLKILTPREILEQLDLCDKIPKKQVNDFFYHFHTQGQMTNGQWFKVSVFDHSTRYANLLGYGRLAKGIVKFGEGKILVKLEIIDHWIAFTNEIKKNVWR